MFVLGGYPACLSAFTIWVDKASARIIPMNGKRCKRSSQLKFKTLKSCKEKACTKDTAYLLFMIYVFFDNKNERSKRVNQGVQSWQILALHNV